MRRRAFIGSLGALALQTAGAAGALGLGGCRILPRGPGGDGAGAGGEGGAGAAGAARADAAAAHPFEISLAEWSLNKTLFARKLDPLDFAPHARREFDIAAVEHVDQFFADRAADEAYLREMRKRADDAGVRSLLVMVDTAGDLGAVEGAARQASIDAHRRWMDAAKALDCHSLRINTRGGGTPAELARRIVQSCSALAEHGEKLGLNVIVENHGGPSSDPDWLAGVVKEVGSPWFGTLPDFGNFPDSTDRYAAVEALMPFARAVSAKTGPFDASGKPADTDYDRMMRLVLDAGYRGFVGIESTGGEAPEDEPGFIRRTRDVLEAIRARGPMLRPIFDGRSLDGWVREAGGDWTVEDGVLVAKNGKDWSTDPSRTGSWLRTEREYGDFELLVEFTLAPGSNSGIFFRSSLERNPAFTGYEVQLHDSPGSPPRKSGPGALYDVAAPAKNLLRPAGEWNTARLIARGQRIRVHMNDELVLSHTGDRALRGYIGLQNHDERSEIRFRRVLLAELGEG